MYQHAVASTSLCPMSCRFGMVNSCSLIKASKTPDPSRSEGQATSIVVLRPRFSQISTTLGHLKKACAVSLQCTVQIGQTLLVMMCLFASTALHGKVPCRNLQQNIFTFAETLSDQMLCHTGLT
jgi:hypothetical protein